MKLVSSAPLQSPLVPIARATVSGWVSPSRRGRAVGLAWFYSRSWRVVPRQRGRLRELLDRIDANRERLRTLYGEFDVDADLVQARAERDAHIDSV